MGHNICVFAGVATFERGSSRECTAAFPVLCAHNLAVVQWLRVPRKGISRPDLLIIITTCCHAVITSVVTSAAVK